MGIVVLTEYEIEELSVLINDRKGVKLMIPDNIVSFL